MMSTSLAVAPLDVAPTAQAAPVTQNLFEQIAAQAHGLPTGSSPSELGGELLRSMDGFLDRVKAFGQGAAERTQPRAAVATSEESGRTGLGDEQMQRMIDSLGRTFDYSTEVAMVVRNTSSVSSSVNTLLRGQ